MTLDIRKAQYLAELETWTRAELLRACRAGRITAHKLETSELPTLLWLNFGRLKAERDMARESSPVTQ